MILPPSVVLELTYKCNHRCIFCSCPWDAPDSKYPKGKELCLDEWKVAIDKLYQIGIQTFSISGGEAILKDCMPEIVEYIHTEGLVSSAKTTAILFRKAKSLGMRTTLNVTVTRKNYHELFETLSMGLVSGASSILLNRFLPGGRGLSYMKELMLTPEQINGMLDTAEEVLSLSNRYGNLGTEVAYCAIKQPKKYKRLQVGYQCAAAKGFFVIDPSGHIRTCNNRHHKLIRGWIHLI